MKEWDYQNDQWTKLPPHLRHLPLFTRHLDILSLFFRALWALILKGFFYIFYIRLKVKGDFHGIYRNYPRLLVISNHSSHLDAVTIAAAIPFRYWLTLYIAAAKDYFFSNSLFTFFSKHCLGAIPIDRKEKRKESIDLCLTLLKKLERIWLIMFPEGTRSPDGQIQHFKRGVSLFSQQTNTPILFLYLEGSHRLWPKGQFFSKPGPIHLYIGPVVQPATSEEIHRKYEEWVKSIQHSF